MQSIKVKMLSKNVIIDLKLKLSKNKSKASFSTLSSDGSDQSTDFIRQQAALLKSRHHYLKVTGKVSS